MILDVWVNECLGACVVCSTLIRRLRHHDHFQSVLRINHDHFQLGLQINHLEVKMDNIVVVEVLHPAAYLSHEQTTIGLSQVEVLVSNPLKQLSTVQVLHDQNHLQVRFSIRFSWWRFNYLARVLEGLDEADNVWVRELLQQVDLLHNL